MNETISPEMVASIHDLIDPWRAELVGFACQLISTSSANPPGDERAVVAVLKDKMEELGLGRLEVVSADERRPNLLCWVEGSGLGRTLILNGHTDTVGVVEPESWRSDPLQPDVLDGELAGLGAADMKASLAAMVFAARAVSRLREAWRGTLLLALSADEEYGSRYGVQYLVREHGLTGDAAVVCEPSGLESDFDCLHVACRGISRFRFIVLGTSRHSGFSYLPGTVNASLEMAWLLEMARGLLKFEDARHDRYPQGAAVNLGLRIESGSNYGIIPKRAEAWNEIRTLPGMVRSEVEDRLGHFVDLCRGERPDLRLELAFESPPLDWTPGIEIGVEEPIVQSARRAGELLLPEAPRLAGYPATTDARYFVADGGIPTIPAFGPGLITRAHAPNEKVSVESMVNAAKIYALMAIDYLR